MSSEFAWRSAPATYRAEQSQLAKARGGETGRPAGRASQPYPLAKSARVSEGPKKCAVVDRYSTLNLDTSIADRDGVRQQGT